MAETVRLTIQLRDMDNKVRLQERKDVPLNSVGETAGTIAGRMGRYFNKERRDAKAAANNGQNS